MKLIRALFGIMVLAIAAALPWIVQDHLNSSNTASTAPNEATGSVHQTDPIGSKMLATVRGWLELDGLPSPTSRSPHAAVSLAAVSLPTSKRSTEAARRVSPSLTSDLSKLRLKIGDPIFVRIFKEEKELEVWMLGKGKSEYALFKTYRIAKHSGKLGPKLKEGDRQAPEGFYFVPPSRMNPNSRYHLAFDLGYPNTYDRHHARTGGFLMVHGGAVSIGCFAMTDPKIEEIYTLAAASLSGGQRYFRVHSFPFRMTDKRMNAEANKKAKWLEFWANLKEGYDYFEMMKLPPNVSVKTGKYTFGAG